MKKTKKFNCAEIMETFMDSVDCEYADVTKECTDIWGDNYAAVIVDLMEEDYRDYDELRRDLFDKFKELTPGVPWRACLDKNKPTSKYIVEYSRKSCGLSFELFFYNVPWLEKQP